MEKILILMAIIFVICSCDHEKKEIQNDFMDVIMKVQNENMQVLKRFKTLCSENSIENEYVKTLIESSNKIIKSDDKYEILAEYKVLKEFIAKELDINELNDYFKIFDKLIQSCNNISLIKYEILRIVNIALNDYYNKVSFNHFYYDNFKVIVEYENRDLKPHDTLNANLYLAVYNSLKPYTVIVEGDTIPFKEYMPLKITPNSYGSYYKEGVLYIDNKHKYEFNIKYNVK